MSKVDYDIIRTAVKVADVENVKASRIFAAIDDLLAREEQDRADKEPAVKKQFVIIVNDPFGRLANAEFAGWVVQIPEDDAPMQALERLHKGVYDFNLTPKGRRMPIKTVEEACEFGSAKVYKEHKVWVKTKEPVLVLRTNGKITKFEETED